MQGKPTPGHTVVSGHCAGKARARAKPHQAHCKLAENFDGVGAEDPEAGAVHLDKWGVQKQPRLLLRTRGNALAPDLVQEGFMLVPVNQGHVESQRLHCGLPREKQSVPCWAVYLSRKMGHALACARFSDFEKSSKMYSKLRLGVLLSDENAETRFAHTGQRACYIVDSHGSAAVHRVRFVRTRKAAQTIRRVRQAHP